MIVIKLILLSLFQYTKYTEQGSDRSLISGHDTAGRVSDCFSVYSVPRYLVKIDEEEEEAKPSHADDSKVDFNEKVSPMTEEQLRAAIGAVQIVEKGAKAGLPGIRAMLDKEADKAGLSCKVLDNTEAVYDEVAKDDDNILDDTAMSIYMDAVSSPKGF